MAIATCQICSLHAELGLGDTAKNVTTTEILQTVDINNYHDKSQIITSVQFKGWFLLRKVDETRWLIVVLDYSVSSEPDKHLPSSISHFRNLRQKLF